MDVTIEMQVGTALKSLWAMFPAALRISVALDCHSENKPLAGVEIISTWDVFVELASKSIIESDSSLSTAVAKVMLASAKKPTMVSFANALLGSQFPARNVSQN